MTTPDQPTHLRFHHLRRITARLEALLQPPSPITLLTFEGAGQPPVPTAMHLTLADGEVYHFAADERPSRDLGLRREWPDVLTLLREQVGPETGHWTAGFTVFTADPELGAQVRATYGPEVTALELVVGADSSGHVLEDVVALQGEQPLLPTWEAAWADPARRAVLGRYGVTDAETYAQVLGSEGARGAALADELEAVVIRSTNQAGVGRALKALIAQCRLCVGQWRLLLPPLEEAAGDPVRPAVLEETTPYI